MINENLKSKIPKGDGLPGPQFSGSGNCLYVMLQQICLNQETDLAVVLNEFPTRNKTKSSGKIHF